MRKVLFKSWIPVQYQKEPDKRNVVIPGTGCRSTEFNQEAIFETWAISYDTQNDCNGNIIPLQYTAALVILPDGTLEEVVPSNLKFIL